MADERSTDILDEFSLHNINQNDNLLSPYNTQTKFNNVKPVNKIQNNILCVKKESGVSVNENPENNLTDRRHHGIGNRNNSLKSSGMIIVNNNSKLVKQSSKVS